jgi:tetratricopeptide (TPR) repeat protein
MPAVQQLVVAFLLLSAPWALAQPTLPRSAQACFELGEDLMARHQYGEAHEALTACLQRDPYFADAYYTRGLARERLERWQDALTDYNIYLEFRPAHPEALLNRAQLRFRLGQFEPARKDLLVLLQAPPGETTTVFFKQSAFGQGVNQVFTTQGSGQAYLYHYLGLTELALRHPREAIAAFNRALALGGPDADVLVNRGRAYEVLELYDSAGFDYKAALQREPRHALAKHNLAVLAGPQQQADTLLAEAIADNPEMPYAFAERAFTRLEQGDFAGALADYNQAIRIDSTQVDYYLNRGLANERLGRPEAAFRDYTRALNLQDNYQKAWLNRGNLLSHLGKLEEAVKDYDVAIALNPGYAPAYYNRAAARYRLGKHVLACQDVVQAERLGHPVPPKLKKQVCPGQ